MFHIVHKWASLKGNYIEVRRKRIGFMRIESVYRVEWICEIEGCTAGKTNDNYIVPDVRMSVYMEDKLSETRIRKVRSKQEKL